MNTDNKELLLAAIDDYDPYNKSQRKLLKAFVELAVNDCVATSITSISKLIGVTRPAIYTNLSLLEKDGFITKIKSAKANLGEYKINHNKLDYIIEVYTKKQNFISKNPTNN